MESARDWSVYAVWITGEPKHEYAKVRADEGVIGLGRGVSIQRTGMESKGWQAARVGEAPDKQRPWVARMAYARGVVRLRQSELGNARRGEASHRLVAQPREPWRRSRLLDIP